MELIEAERDGRKSGSGEKGSLKDYLFRFSMHPGTFRAEATFCGDPSCTTAHMILTQVDDEAIPIERGLCFSLDINTETGEECENVKRPPDVEPVVSEFLACVTGEVKDLLEATRESAHRMADHLADFHLPRKYIDEALLFPFADALPDDKSIVSGGRACTYKMTFKGRNLYVNDLYCPNPECNCNEAHLVFMEADETQSDRMVLKDALEAKISFEGKPEIKATSGLSREEAGEIIEEWQRRFPDASEELEERYATVKLMGMRTLARMAETASPTRDPKIPKTSRNDPCPCGSGKKYKKCCGR